MRNAGRRSFVRGLGGHRKSKQAVLFASLGFISALASGGAFAASTTFQAESMSRSGGYVVDGTLIKLGTADTGTATQTFSGTSGTYNIDVYVELENDGRPDLKVYKGSTLLRDYTYPLGTNGQSASFTISNVPLVAGDVIKLVGTVNAGALARVDKVVLTQVTTTTPTTTTTTTTTTPTTTTTTTGTTSTTMLGTPITYQAEAMSRSSGYVVDGTLIKIPTATSATATQSFGGKSGTYNLQVFVELESDGRPNLKVYRGSALLANYTYPLGTNGTAATFSVNNISLVTGDTIKLLGTVNGGALARVDKIVLTPVITSTTTTTSTGTTTTTTSTGTTTTPTGTTTTPTSTSTTTTPTDTTTSSLPSTGTKAVATFESLGLYWTPPASPGSAGCEVQYRKSGDSAFKKGLNMWFDSRNGECRGSLVMLTPGTSYEVQFAMPGKAPVAGLIAKTWSESFPIAKTVTVSGGTQTLNITQGGTASGYVLYTAAPGTTIDVGNSAANNITVSAPYVIIRGLTLKGAQRDAIDLLAGAHDVVIEDNDISGWGRFSYTNSAGWNIGVDSDSGVRCRNVLSVERIVIQRNAIHDPRYGANSWSWGHPGGPQGTTFDTCGGNHVIRHNDIYSSDRHYFNDGIGGSDNFTDAGFPRADSDIYGNKISQTWDDGIEAEGANPNVRIWGNYMNQTATGVATTVVNRGPIYIFRNVYNRSRQLSETAPDSDDRNTFAKSATGQGFGNGRRYVFHNTLLQAPPAAGSTLPSGAGLGINGPGGTLTNTVTRNNIFHIWKSWWSSIASNGGGGDDVDYDLRNGNIDIAGGEAHGIVGTPIYQTGNGWSSESNGMYQLAPNSPGYDAGAVLPNFNDGFTGAAPDIGAHEAGTPAMKFGRAAGTKEY